MKAWSWGGRLTKTDILCQELLGFLNQAKVERTLTMVATKGEGIKELVSRMREAAPVEMESILKNVEGITV